MFYPKFSRRDESYYHTERKSFYADYRSNYKWIVEDCQERCAYCDITIEESGGDEMHLDHFRPQKYYNHLRVHPHNLYLACPKCNYLKKDDWPAFGNENVTYVGSAGYIDRFQVEIKDFLVVNSDGKVSALAHPAEYMIKKLHLNRASRVNIRRKRQLSARKTQILTDISALLAEISAAKAQGKLTAEEALVKYELITPMFIEVRNL